jgi:hypothetical protein
VNSRGLARRQLTEVFEDLFLGGSDAAQAVDQLKAAGVTGVINATQGKGARFGVGNAAPETFECAYSGKRGSGSCSSPRLLPACVVDLSVPVVDADSTDLAAHFDAVCAFVTKHHEKGGKVLIHCECPARRRVCCRWCEP